MIGLLQLTLRVAFFLLAYGLLFWLLLLARRDFRAIASGQQPATRSTRRTAAGAYVTVSSSTDYHGERLVPVGRELLIGRGAQCGLRLEDSSVSAAHARIYAAEGRYLVEDLGSTNGTVVAGKRVSNPTPLRSGDVLTLGRTVLMFKDRR